MCFFLLSKLFYILVLYVVHWHTTHTFLRSFLWFSFSHDGPCCPEVLSSDLSLFLFFSFTVFTEKAEADE